jgi:hypothetical protein
LEKEQRKLEMVSWDLDLTVTNNKVLALSNPIDEKLT